MAKKQIIDEELEQSAPSSSETADSTEESVENKVQEYLAANPGYSHDTIILTSDGVFFSGNQKGINACVNYCGEKHTYTTFNVV